MPISRCRALAPMVCLWVGGALAFSASAHAQTCEFLTPVGGDGVTNIVTKTIGLPKMTPIGMIAGKTNWNTDFFVTKPYSSYKFFFTADSSVSATYPIQGFLKFSDGSNLKVINESFTPQIGTGRMFGPFPAVPGKSVSQLNFKIGTTSDLAATGFTYRISTQGCF
jgi:hypothetical protein